MKKNIVIQTGIFIKEISEGQRGNVISRSLRFAGHSIFSTVSLKASMAR